jgi:hypothetical protein
MLLAAALLAAGGAILPAVSQAGVNLDIDVGPPAPIVETVPPPPQPEYVWAPGYWEWNGGRHVWVAGHYMPPNRGHHWVPDRWDRRDGHYHHEHGHWD